jgi:2-polyprenyl-3-methyl-5-hydroxy-6-metoxy-1,4-benzoquinol methylase
MQQTSRATWKDAEGITHAGELLETVNAFEVVDCEHCRFKHVLPVPTAQELETIYSHEYYSTEKPLYIERYLEDKEWWDAVYAARYDKLEELLSPERRKLLDVGSGPGLFLKLGEQRGWHVMGIEPSEKAAEYSKNTLKLDIRECFLNEETSKTLGKFDAINMGEVLEHLPDPKGMLKIAFDMLEVGGVLTLIVPNDFNPFQQILRENCGFEPWWVAPPHHLNYFNIASLSELVKSVGFKVEHTETTFPIDMFLLMGKNYVGNDELGREVHQLRKNFELNINKSSHKHIINDLYSSLSNNGIGREILLFAKKC